LRTVIRIALGRNRADVALSIRSMCKARRA
jgi:hypothetical protein